MLAAKNSFLGSYSKINKIIATKIKVRDKPAMNNWQKKVAANSIVIPKSGWRINKVINNKKKKYPITIPIKLKAISPFPVPVGAKK